MTTLTFEPRPMDQLLAPDAPADPTDWVWDGYLARANLTLLTSQWKAGKTTLVAGLLRAMSDGGPFLGRPCRPGTAVVVSEESVAHWAARGRAVPVGPHARLVSRPFPGRPAPADWADLARRAADLRPDLVVVDPLAPFLPGRSESDPGTLLDFLGPLRRAADGGAAVLVLHHPRRQSAEEGSTARGGGALLGHVDVTLELHRLSQLPTDAHRRRLVGRSRLAGTPAVTAYEWTPGTPDFRAVEDVAGVRFRENWAVVKGLLEGRDGATHRDLLGLWPADRVPPSYPQLYDWLGRATAGKLVVRSGRGTKTDPYRFGLPHGRPKLLPDLPPLE